MFNPLAQVLITDNSGKEIYTFGYGSDIPLLDLSWSLEVNENGSACELSIPLFKDVLDTLLQIKPYIPETTTKSQNPKTTSVGNTVEAKNKEEHIKVIITEARRQGITNPKQLAYILATVEHETNWVNFTELSSGEQYEGRPDLGNNQRGDGVKYKGRGYVQLTGRANYEKYSRITGKDLVGNPGLVAQSPIREFVLIHGFKNGSFTGVSLADYTSSSGSVDYYNARDIISGDKGINGSSIANAARTYENHPLIKNPQTTSVTSKTVSENTNTPSANQPSHKILVRVGELGVLFVEYVYLMSEVSVSVSDAQTIQISGVTPLWAINQYKQTYTIEGVSLKQLAERVAKKSNLSLEFSGKGTEIIHLENNGLTDYQLLLRESKKAGYTISNQGTKLVVKPVRQGNQYILESQDILNFSASIVPGSALPQTSGGIRGSWEMKPKTTSDPKSGTIQTKSNSTHQANKPKTEKESKTTGTVTLESGKTITESQAQVEVSRVQDFPSQVSFIPEAADLLLSPTDMVKINGLEKYSDRLTKIEYYISSVAYQFNDQGLIGTLKMYQPGIEVKASQELAGNSSNTSITPISAGDGSFIVPMKGNVILTSGSRFTNPGRANHNGIDITSTTDKNIYASANGQVIDREGGCVEGDRSCGGGYGNLVYIKHANGYETRYAHLTRNNVRVGQMVRQGEVIGIEGNTGRSDGAHLHFEIRLNGLVLDPLTKIPRF